MASDQATLKNKADLEQIVKEVKDNSSSSVKKEIKVLAEKKLQTTTTTTIYGVLDNRTTVKNVPMSFHDRHEWTGSVPEVEPYPKELSKDLCRMFVLPGPSKAGVAYVLNHRMWILAWDSTNNKIYVEGGHKGPIDWTRVEAKLDASGNASVSRDKLTDAKAMGVIETSTSNVNVISAFL